MHTNDAILRHVNQTTRQITRVRRLQRRIGQTLPGTVGGVEVLKNRQTFFKVRDDRRFDDLARRLGHQTTHTAQLLHLRRRATRTGVRHHVDAFGSISAPASSSYGRDFVHHRVGHLIRTLRPGIDNLVVLFTLSDQAVHVLLFEFLDLIADVIDDVHLLSGMTMSSLPNEMPALNASRKPSVMIWSQKMTVSF